MQVVPRDRVEQASQPIDRMYLCTIVIDTLWFRLGAKFKNVQLSVRSTVSVMVGQVPNLERFPFYLLTYYYESVECGLV